MTIFQYNWHLDVEGAANALGIFQDFVQTNIPAELGAELVLTKGAVEGNVTFGLSGAWHGPLSRLNATVASFLKAMPPLNAVTLFTGNWIESVENLGGGSVNTTGPDNTDTFYAKSLMTPEASPMSPAARKGFMSWLAHEGFNVQNVVSRD